MVAAPSGSFASGNLSISAPLVIVAPATELISNVPLYGESTTSR